MTNKTPSSSPIKPRLITIKEASIYTGIPVNTLYKMVSQGRIPYAKLGGLLRFDLAKIDDWIDGQTRMPMPPKHY